MSLRRKKDQLSEAKENSGKKPIRNPDDELLKNTCREMAAGYLQYNFADQRLDVSESLLSVFQNCFPDSNISVESFVEQVAAEDKSFIQDIFSLPKAEKKISGQFKLIQKIKESREIRTFLIIAQYDLSGDSGPSLICYIRDISKETKQIRDLQRNLERSEESDRIKTNYMLNISHNIRTPMNSILGFAELLSLSDPDPLRRKEYVQVIKKQSKGLMQLIDDVAEIARYENGSMTITKTPVNINLLFNDIIKDIDNLRSASRKNHVSVSRKTPSREGVEIYTDGGRLHQVFMNLVTHSLKYTFEGNIEIGYSLPEENRIDFYVKDTSPGLSREELKSIFDQFALKNKEDFSRYDDETGLGLTIAKSIIKLLGGKINAESEEENGVTFNFSLPYEAVPSQVSHSIEEELIASHYKWNDRVILVVEDEDVNGLFLEAVFQETGAQTLHAKNGKEAVQLCKSISKIDLILMDLKMPVMNGLKATEEIRKFNTSIPIIAQTALSQDIDRENCLLSGCNDVIAKPIEVEKMLNLVGNYFAH